VTDVLDLAKIHQEGRVTENVTTVTEFTESDDWVMQEVIRMLIFDFPGILLITMLLLLARQVAGG